MNNKSLLLPFINTLCLLPEALGKAWGVHIQKLHSLLFIQFSAGGQNMLRYFGNNVLLLLLLLLLLNKV